MKHLPFDVIYIWTKLVLLLIADVACYLDCTSEDNLCLINVFSSFIITQTEAKCNCGNRFEWKFEGNMPTECNTACPADTSEICGNNDKVLVYRIRDSKCCCRVSSIDQMHCNFGLVSTKYNTPEILSPCK